jgi:very-short-patch-repair endonuclease
MKGSTMKLTKETRDKISKSRKKYLSENKDKHPWKNNLKFKSVPCENVKKYLQEKGIKFVDEWQPLSDRFYSIDIAFPDIKFGIEINGNQHYNADGTLKDYYQKRHDEIVSQGWKLLELHYSISWNLDKLDRLLEIKEQPCYKEYFDLKKKREVEKQKNMPLQRGVKYSMNISEKWNTHKQIVMTCDIDFSKFGWGVKLSKILGISPQKSIKWMKRYFPEKYEKDCYKKKIQQKSF